MTSVATSTSRSLNVRTSDAQSRCNRNRQPRPSNAHPYTAVCTRRCRLTMQSESQTSCTLPLVLHQPMHTVRQRPARKYQQLATAVPTNAGGCAHNTVPRHTNDSRAHSSPKPNHFCTHNWRASPHQFVQLAHAQSRAIAGTPNRNEQLGLYKNCVIMAAHNAPQSRAPMHNCSVVSEPKPSDVWGNQTARY